VATVRTDSSDHIRIAVSPMSVAARGVIGRTLSVMAGDSRLKDGVAYARLCPAIHVFLAAGCKDVDARDKPGHDDFL
jgi:hypothetical protein